MERFSCGRSKCKHLGYKYCLNCKTMLCRRHRTWEIKRQQKNKAPEHHYVDASKYINHSAEFACLYCKVHPNAMVTHRCINCDSFACKECPEDWCLKAPGRYHDFEPIGDFMCTYKNRLSDFQKILQLNHGIFLAQLKEACIKLDKINLDLEKMLITVDSVVQSKVIAIREEGERFKNKISREITNEKSLISENIKSIEANEATSRQLLHDISELLKTADGAMVMHNYTNLKEQITDLLMTETKVLASLSFDLKEDAERVPLCLRLWKTSLKPVDGSDRIFLSDVKAMEEKQIVQYYATRTQPTCLTFLSAEKLIAGFIDTSLTSTIIGVIEKGKTTSSTLFKCLVLQLLPYGNQILMLTAHPFDNKYKIFSMNQKTVLYEYVSEITTGLTAKRLFPYSPKMAITRERRLMVLDAKTQTLHMVSLEYEWRKAVSKLENLRDGLEAVALMVSSGDTLILTCTMEGRLLIVMYCPKCYHMIWMSDPLGELLLSYHPLGLLQSRLFVSGYKNYLYAIHSDEPTKVWRLNLRNGFIEQEIFLNDLPATIEDISMRGNILAVSGRGEGIKVFRIMDIIDAMEMWKCKDRSVPNVKNK